MFHMYFCNILMIVSWIVQSSECYPFSTFKEMMLKKKKTFKKIMILHATCQDPVSIPSRYKEY